MATSTTTPPPLPPLTQIPHHVVALDDYIPLAKERMTPSIWAYLAGGAADEYTLQSNREAYRNHTIIPRALADLRGATTQLELLGTKYHHPIIVAPTAYHRMFHPDGEIATALGSSAIETLMTVSTSATTTLEEIAAHASISPWFQLYIQHDRAFTLNLVKRAEAAGYSALVVTVDAPLNGLRNREHRANFQPPAGIDAVNLRGMTQLPPADRVFGSAQLETAPLWEDIQWLTSHTNLPIILKGVMHPADARLAITNGAKGIIISNHGGRVLDTAPATLAVLAKIAKEVNSQVPVILDGGIHRGSDVFKALALGANAVMTGRPILYGLAAAGAVGVAHTLRILRAELEMTMALAGCKSIQDIKPECLS
ncbi:MAG: alpha-hydroxy acid oxidase [Akkermansiaceae bacterium]